MRILLTAGGWSDEREVSLAGARVIAEALRDSGHEVVDFDPAADFDRLMHAARGCDFAFINLHGSPGEDGLVQALLDAAGVPYQGADARGSLLTLHKAAAKQVFRESGLATPDWELVARLPEGDYEPSVGFPLFAKPCLGGSSLRMSFVHGPDELAPALAAIFDSGDAALLEAYVPGIELTCAVLGEDPLPPILIKPKDGADFFDFASKYDDEGAEEICPAPVEEALTLAVQDNALSAHKALGLSGCSRADFMVDANGVPQLIEVNTLPGMTPTSLLPKAASAAGIPFTELLERLIALGLARAARTG
jgi:D-alanine-D-alanine ligase